MKEALEEDAGVFKRNLLPATVALPVFSDSSAEIDAARVTVLMSLECDGDNELLRLVPLYCNVLYVNGLDTEMTGTTWRLVSAPTFAESLLSI